MRVLVLVSVASMLSLGAASGQSRDALQGAVDGALKPSIVRGVPSAFAGVHGTVVQGIVTLTGSVPVYSAKLDAEVAISRVPGVRTIRDEVQVAGPSVSDAALQARLTQRVHTKAIAVVVRNSQVELDGEHVDPSLAAAAFEAAANTPGVHGVVSRMGVERPASTGLGPMPYTISSLP